MRTQNRFIVGDWEVRPDENLLVTRDTKQQIETRVMAVLVYLSQNQGQVVSIEELQESVWKNQVVSTNAIYRAIAELRKVLEDPTSETYINTIKTKGYCLIQPVKPIHSWTYLMPAILSLLVIGFVIYFGWIQKTIDTQEPEPVEFSDSVNLIPASFLMGLESQPALYPDGSLLAYVHQSADMARNQVLIQPLTESDAKPSNPTRSGDFKPTTIALANPKTTYHLPTWSNDGTLFAFISSTSDTCYVEIADFDPQQLTLANTRQVAICDLLGIAALEFNADDTKLLYTSMHTARMSVHAVSITGNNLTTLLTPEQNNSWNYHFAASPFENEVVILRFQGLKGTIFQHYNLSTEEMIEIHTTDHPVSSITWGNDPETILYSDSRNSLIELNIKTGISKPFLVATNAIGAVDSAINSESFALEQISQSSRAIKILSLGDYATEAATSINSVYDDYSAAFANQSNQIAFVSNRDGVNQLWLRHIDNKELKLTHFTQQGWMSSPRWSVDDQAILFARQGSIYLLDMQSGDLSTLLDTNTNESIFFAPTWSRTNDYIYYSEFRNDRYLQYKYWLNMPDSDPEFVAENVRKSIESDDGQYIYFTYVYQHGLHRFNILEGTTELVTDRLHSESWNSWILHGDRIYFMDTFQSPHQIKVIDSRTLRTELISTSNAAVNAQFSINHNKTLLALDDTQQGNSDIFLLRKSSLPSGK